MIQKLNQKVSQMGVSSHSINANENETYPGTCRVCLLLNADSIILTCRHAQICYPCAEKLPQMMQSIVQYAGEWLNIISKCFCSTFVYHVCLV